MTAAADGLKKAITERDNYFAYGISTAEAVRLATRVSTLARKLREEAAA